VRCWTSAVSEGAAETCVGVVVADARDAAARGGLRAGDRIVNLNGVVPLDVLDVEDAAADGALWLSVLRDGHPLDLVVALKAGEWHGISLDRGGLGDDPRTCRNACRFCFVDQVPVGLRAALSVKDDDYRLSFLHGNFMTLTNLREEDIQRIEDLRLSPLYVSLHAWDDAARARLMGRAASGSRKVLERLAQAGLELHLQVVLCPGWNDGDVLAETVRRTGELDAVADLGVVPVSLAAEGDLRRVTPHDARATIAAVEGWQHDFVARRGAAFVHAADEFYLLAGAQPPGGAAPEQYENGVGITAALLAEAAALAHAWVGGEVVDEDAPPAPPKGVTGVRLLTGTLARPVLERAGELLGAAAGVPALPFAVENRVFGPHVTVTGLLGGGEVLDALRRDALSDGEWLLAPRTWLPADLGCTLDDVPEDGIQAACGGRLVVAETLSEAFARLSE
jgi:putative radical SAM enzyme (TIGR03279 family)